MSRTRRALYGFVTDLGSQLILTAASFLMAPIILKYTSSTLYGFWLTALSVLSYIGLVDIGLGLAFTQAIAVRAGRAEDRQLNQLISTGFFAFLTAGATIAVVGLSFAHWIPTWFGIPSGDAQIVIRAYRVVVIATAISLPCGIFNGVICGFQRMAVDNLLRTFVSIAALVVSVVLLRLGLGLMALAMSTLFSAIGVALCAAYFAWRCHPGIRVRFALFNRKDLREMIHFGGYFQLGKIANTVAMNSDSVVISGILGAQKVTPYVFTSKLATLFSFTVASKLPIAAFPAMAQLFAARDLPRLRTITLRLSAYATRLAVVGASVFLAVNEQFVSLWVGPGQFGGYALCGVFCYWILQDTLYRGTSSIVFASGNLRTWAFASLIEAALNIASSIILVRSVGLVGVALGTSIAKTLTTAWIVPVLICREVELSWRDYAWLGVLRPALFSLGTPLIAMGLAQWLTFDLGWLRVILVGAGTFVVAVLPFEGVAFLKNPNQYLKSLSTLIR